MICGSRMNYTRTWIHKLEVEVLKTKRIFIKKYII
jgi:hypothetical protein